MPLAEGIWERRMREIRTSGVTSGERPITDALLLYWPIRLSICGLAALCCACKFVLFDGREPNDRSGLFLAKGWFSSRGLQESARGAREEGGRRDWQIKTKQFVGDEKGHVKELHAVRVHQYFDEAGDRQFEELHGSDIVFPCELVLLAIGFSGPEKGLTHSLGLELTENGAIKSNRRYMTSMDCVFAAGDCRRGQSIVV